MLLDYTTYINVLGTPDFFSKLRGWCAAHGWTEEEWIPEVSWSVTGAGAGRAWWVDYTGGGFLQLSKTGYGTQNLIVSLVCVANEEFSCHGITGNMRSQVEYIGGNFGDQENPACQNVLAGPRVGGAPNLYYNLGTAICGAIDLTRDSVIPKVWFFAGPHWICAVAQMNSVFCHMIHFGSFEMYEDNPSQGQVFGLSAAVYSPAAYDYNWGWSVYTYGGNHAVPFTGGYEDGFSYYRVHGLNFYYNSAPTTPIYGDDYYYLSDNCRVSGPKYSTAGGYGGTPLLDLAPALKANHYSEKRPLIKPVYFAKHPVVDGPIDNCWQPFCRAPVWATRFSGLQIGSQIDYGDESYLVFPTRTVYSVEGYAFRIA